MALSVVLSFLLALYLRFSKSPVSRALGKLYLLPRFIPGIAAVYAVKMCIRDRALFVGNLAKRASKSGFFRKTEAPK